MLLLGRLIIGGIIAAVIASAIVIYINGRINRSSIKSALESKNVKGAIIKQIDSCSNVVTLEELESDQEYEIHGDDVDISLNTGEVIYV